MSTKKITTAANEQPQVIVSCEDPSKTYLCYKGIRFIFQDDKYIGWYRPDEEPKEEEKPAYNPADNILIGKVNGMLGAGLTAKGIAEKTGLPLTKIRDIIKLCKGAEKRKKDIKSWYNKGTAVKDIANHYGISETTVRRIIKEG